MHDWPFMLLDLAKLLLAAFVGGWVANYFQVKVDRLRRAQDWRADKLAEAYLLVSESLEQPGMSPDEAFSRKKKLEDAINLVDLYGDQKIKDAAKEIVEGYSRNDEWVVYDRLRLLLRDGFRNEMGLEKLNDLPLRIEFQISVKVEDKEETS